MREYKRYVEKRNRENVIPLRNAICGIDMPKWELRTANDNEMFLSGEAVDRLAELEEKLEDGRLWEAKYLEPRPHPFECAERWAELFFEANCKLNELKEKIENGTLVELPCKVGDKVYYVNENSPTPRIEEYVVYGILLDESRIILHIDYWETIMAKDVYYTKPEAEARLEQIRKGNNND